MSAKGLNLGVNVSVTRETALANTVGSYPNVMYFPTDSNTIIFNGKEYSGNNSETNSSGNNSISGTLDVTKSTTTTIIQNAYKSLASGEMLFYLISDSSGNLPSLKGETYVTFDTDVAKLVNTTGDALGASVGDLFIVAKVKIILVDVLVCRVLPINDAKAANGSFPGAMGLESVWDKTQINKIPGLVEDISKLGYFTKDGTNMNECLETGVYPWCNLGRPANSTGHYTLYVQRSSTPDGDGYYSIDQTAYGREAEVGQIWKRTIFVNDSRTNDNYGEWIRIDNEASQLNVYKCPQAFRNVRPSNYPNFIIGYFGEFKALYNAICNGKTIVDAAGTVAYANYTISSVYTVHLTYFSDSVMYIITIAASMNDYIYQNVVVDSYHTVPASNLLSTSVVTPLAANQGKILNDKITTINTTLTNLSNKVTGLIYHLPTAPNEWLHIQSDNKEFEDILGHPALLASACLDPDCIIMSGKTPVHVYYNYDESGSFVYVRFTAVITQPDLTIKLYSISALIDNIFKLSNGGYEYDNAQYDLDKSDVYLEKTL